MQASLVVAAAERTVRGGSRCAGACAELPRPQVACPVVLGANPTCAAPCPSAPCPLQVLYREQAAACYSPLMYVNAAALVELPWVALQVMLFLPIM